VQPERSWRVSRYGFLACLTLRLALFLVWHVLWGFLNQAPLVPA
jgi:hypothetical protein